MQEMQSRVFFDRTIGTACREGAQQGLKNSDQEEYLGNH